VGFGLSSDCERVSMVTDRGVPLGTPATLPLAVQSELSSRDAGQTVVASIASDSRVDQVAARHGASVVRSGVGIQAVMELVSLEHAALGGEGSGGVALSSIHLAFDGLAVMVRLLEQVALHGSSDELAQSLPQIHLRAVEVPSAVGAGYAAVARLREQAMRAECTVTDLDGIRVDLEHGWYYARVSHTEPVVRIICEEQSAERADERIQQLRREVHAAVQE